MSTEVALLRRSFGNLLFNLHHILIDTQFLSSCSYPMAKKASTQLKNAVWGRLKSYAELATGLGFCTGGYVHRVSVSYGLRNSANIGKAYEIVSCSFLA